MSRKPSLKLLNGQRRILKAVFGAAHTTDGGLAAYVEELEQAIDKSWISHCRAGRERAPLGLLAALIDYQDEGEPRRAVVAAFVRIWGYELADTDEPTDDDASHPERTVMSMVGEAGGILRQTLEATDPTSPGGTTVTPKEAQRLLPTMRTYQRAVKLASRQLEQRANEEA